VIVSTHVIFMTIRAALPPPNRIVACRVMLAWMAVKYVRLAQILRREKNGPRRRPGLPAKPPARIHPHGGLRAAGADRSLVPPAQGVARRRGAAFHQHRPGALHRAGIRAPLPAQFTVRGGQRARGRAGGPRRHNPRLSARDGTAVYGGHPAPRLGADPTVAAG